MRGPRLRRDHGPGITLPLFPQSRLDAFRRWLNRRNFEWRDFLCARVALADRFLADHLTAKAIHGVFGNNDVCILQKQSDVVIGCPPCQKPFDLSFERKQQREFARKFGLVAAGKLLEASLGCLRMNCYRS